MAKNKQKKFDDVARFENVFEYTDFQEENLEKPKGKWNSEIFKNKNPIVLELACGKAEYTVNLARKYPGKNFIGIDKKGWRIWSGAKVAIDESLTNTHFIRMFIDHLDEYFAPNEVDEIWIIFPDPFLRGSRESNRLTAPKFLNIYKKILKPGAIIRLKTDSPELFSYTLEVIESEQCKIIDRVDDVYKERPDDDELSIKTFYEQMHLQKGKTISYIAFQL